MRTKSGRYTCTFTVADLQKGSAAVPVYDGEGLAKKGLVVVTINYRVGIFGILRASRVERANLATKTSGKLWSAGSGSGARMGARQHREVRRRSGARHNRGTIGRGVFRECAAGVTAGKRSICAGYRGKRLDAGRRGRREARTGGTERGDVCRCERREIDCRTAQRP